MKKISYLLVFVFAILMVNVCLAQDNTNSTQPSKVVNAFFKNVKGEEVTIAELTDNELLTDVSGFIVISFEVNLFVNGDLVTITNTGNKLSERQATLVRKQKSGDKVFIENIKCTDPQGSERMLSALKFVIK